MADCEHCTEPLELTLCTEPLELTPCTEPLELTLCTEPLELTPCIEPLELIACTVGKAEIDRFYPPLTMAKATGGRPMTDNNDFIPELAVT